MANMFSKAKKEAVAKTTKKEEKKLRIKIKDASGNNDQSFFTKIETLEALNERMKSDKAKADLIADEIKNIGKSEWSELYQKIGRNPESVMLESSNVVGDVSQVMFIVMDKYITINADRAEELQEKYGNDIVEEKTTFSFDNEMVDKYGEIISKLIESSSEIVDSDKEKIIKATTAFSIAKGTIDRIKDFGNVAEMVDVVRPVIALKGAEVLKS